MEEKTSDFSLMEQQASSLPLAVAGSDNLCEFVEKDEEKTKKTNIVFSRWYAGFRPRYGSAVTPNDQKTFKIINEKR